MVTLKEIHRQKNSVRAAQLECQWWLDRGLPLSRNTIEIMRYIERLEAQVKPITWTTEKPTKPGWYWWRCASDAPPRCDEVRIIDGLGLSWYGGRVWLKIDIKGGEWSSESIPEPEEVK